MILGHGCFSPVDHIIYQLFDVWHRKLLVIKENNFVNATFFQILLEYQKLFFTLHFKVLLNETNFI